MPSNFFKQFPKTTYSRESSDIIVGDKTAPYEVQTVDIFIQLKIKDAILANTSLFYPYQWKDTDRPDTVALNYYGSDAYWWVVFYSNGAFDLNHDFPIPEASVFPYLYSKYVDDIALDYDPDPAVFLALEADERRSLSYTYLNNTIHHYEIEDQFIVDEDTYNDYALSDKRAVSIYDYEFELNEAKRQVQLLDNEFLQRVVKEFYDQMKKARSEV